MTGFRLQLYLMLMYQILWSALGGARRSKSRALQIQQDHEAPASQCGIGTDETGEKAGSSIVGARSAENFVMHEKLRATLFSDHIMKDRQDETTLTWKDGDTSALGRLGHARHLALFGNAQSRKRAIHILKNMLEGGEELETRVEIWSWTLLRSMGVYPKGRMAREVLGVVLEMPTDNGIDILAAYKDGRARLLHSSGLTTIWEAPAEDHPVADLCNDLLQISQKSLSSAKPRTIDFGLDKSVAAFAANLARAEGFVTLLTRAGDYVAPSEMAVVVAGVQLMVGLSAASQHASANQHYEEDTPGMAEFRREMSTRAPNVKTLFVDSPEMATDNAKKSKSPRAAVATSRTARTNQNHQRLELPSGKRERKESADSRKEQRHSEQPRKSKKSTAAKARMRELNSGKSDTSWCLWRAIEIVCTVDYYCLWIFLVLIFSIIWARISNTVKAPMRLLSRDALTSRSDDSDVVKAAHAIKVVVSRGFNYSVVKHVAKSLGQEFAVDTLYQAVLAKYKEEEDCPICAEQFDQNVVMVLRPCCKQALCLQCSRVCQDKSRACVFCRHEPPSEVNSEQQHRRKHRIGHLRRSAN